MKIFLKCIIVFSFLSCASYSRFTLTGTPFQPIPEDREIKTVPEGDLGGYEEIGIAEIKNSDKEYRISEAKRLARLNGGEIIMPFTEQGKESNGSDIQRFHVLAQVKEETKEEVKEENIEVPDDEILEEPVVQEQPKPEVKTKEKPDYGNLPVVPYRILAGELANLKGEKFRDTLYPKKIIDAPRELASYAGKNAKLLELGAKKGGNTVYLIIAAKDIQIYRRMINSSKELKFVYTPVISYRSYPVLELIDTID